MFKRISAVLNNLKLRNKLILIYSVIGIVPMIVIVFVSTHFMSVILKSNEEQNIKNYLNQATYNIETDLQTYNNLLQYVSVDTAISQVVTTGYSNSYDLYKAITTVIEPQIEVLSYLGDAIKQATIYTNLDGKSYGQMIRPLLDIQSEPWFEEVCKDVKTHWYFDNETNTVFGVSRMSLLRKEGVLSIFYVSIDYEKLFEVLFNDMGKNYGIFVIDENDQVICNTSVFDDEYEKYKLSYEEFKKLDEDSEYVTYTNKLNQAVWKVCMYKPDASIIGDARSIKVLLAVVSVIWIITLVLGFVMVGRFITRRITHLKKSMAMAEGGDFAVRIEEDCNDEIGELIRGYNTLLGKIEKLISEVYESEIQQKKYEMKALQNQINPHFLYNSLSLINWKALENGCEDISDITLALSKFYRTSLNKGKNILSIADEISNVKSYIAIQLVMHDNEFDVIYKIDEEILQCETLNLILQPIVENAIEHGIEMKTNEERGLIIIQGWRNKDNIYISVTDNGAGMDEEKARNIITQNSKGYGVRNVNERIKLYYGEEYSLDVRSNPMEGTCITVCIPFKKMEIV